jgi:hypothetical protein
MIEREFVGGVIPSPPDPRDWPISKLVPAAIYLEEEYHNQEYDEVKDQGMVGACVAHWLAYGLEISRQQVKFPYIRVSPWFIYANRGFGDIDQYEIIDGQQVWNNDDVVCVGMVPRGALKHMVRHGTVPLIDFDVQFEIPEIREALILRREELLKLTGPYRIKAYYRVSTIEEIKIAIKTLGSVGVAVPYGGVWDIYDGIIHFNPDGPGDQLHMMTLVGWSKKGFEVLNSWGPGWGDHGRLYFDYTFPFEEAWAFEIEKPPVPTPTPKPEPIPIPVPKLTIWQKIWLFIQNIFTIIKRSVM